MAKNAAKEAAKRQFKEETRGMKTKIIRKNRDNTGRIQGVGVDTKITTTKKP